MLIITQIFLYCFLYPTGIKEDLQQAQLMPASYDEIDDSKMTIDYQNKGEVIRANGFVVCEVGKEGKGQMVLNLSSSRVEEETVVTDYSQLNEAQMIRTTSEDFVQYSQLTGLDSDDVSQIPSSVQQ